MRYWKFTDLDGSTKSVQSCSINEHIVPDAIEIDQIEFNEYLKSLPVEQPKLARDLPAELDKLKGRVRKLEDELL